MSRVRVSSSAPDSLPSRRSRPGRLSPCSRPTRDRGPIRRVTPSTHAAGMRTRRCVAVVALLMLAGCAGRPEAGAGGDELVGNDDPTGGGFVAVPLGPTSSSTVVPAVALTERPDPVGTEEWRVTRPAAGRISAYTTEISAPPGTEVGLKVSTRAGGYRV